MSTKVGLALAAALPPALNSGKPGLSRTWCHVSWSDLLPRGRISEEEPYLGQPVVSCDLCDIFVFGDKPGQAAVEQRNP